MLSRAMTRRILTGGLDAGNDCFGRELEPRGEIDARLVAERLSRGRDVGPGVADVARPWRLEPSFDLLPEDGADGLRDVAQRRRRPCGDVADPTADIRGLGRADGRVDHVRDVREVA